MPNSSPLSSAYADVVLPLAVPLPYTYFIPQNMAQNMAIGMRVVVALGKRKWYTGIVLNIHQKKPAHATKPILEILDGQPIVLPKQLAFWRWISQYYMCTLGEVMNAAIPAGLKLESQTRLLPNQAFGPNWDDLNDSEYLILEALEKQQTINIADAGKILEVQNPMRIVNNLLAKRAIILEEELKSQSKAKTHTVVSLVRAFAEEELHGILDSLEKSPKQHAILMAFFQINGKYKNKVVPESELLATANASKTSLIGLVKKEILQLQYLLSAPEENSEKKPLHLSPAQRAAYSKIEFGFEAKKPVLLHGVTSSGKTEIYISLIKKALVKHKRALYLVPEISLTTQLIQRLQKHFGNQAVVYHSRLSQGDRLAAYQRLIEQDQPLVLLGARSALLLPLQDLGLVIVDEEHDGSFKQHDPAPRYQARDAAVVLAHQNNCPILLGSATPSAESYHNAVENKYHLVELSERFGGIQLPDVNIIDIRKETLWKTMHGHYSPSLLARIEKTLSDEKRVILFQNRRGYTPVVQCRSCGHTQECPNCDITLTYHKFTHQLKCHYCGFSTKPAQQCGQCGSPDLKEIGFGTEKLEEELQTLLPNARVARMDLDSTRKKNAFQTIIHQFEEGEIDVLIGTQMVTKGLDFNDVNLVGILNADSMLHFPDFRAEERAFQLMAQVAGRSGRRKIQGVVSIQSYKPDHRILQLVQRHDYNTMIKEQLKERIIFGYPPFTKLIHIDFKHRDIARVDAAADLFTKQLQSHFADMILGPEYPPRKRLKNAYHKSVLLKLNRSISMPVAKEFLLKVKDFVLEHGQAKGVRCTFNVDP